MVTTITGYHATSTSKAKNILQSSEFYLKPFDDEILGGGSQRKSPMPGDLGSGAYFFIDDEKYVEASKMATRYYNTHKRNTYNKENPRIIKCELSGEGKFNKLDMNTPDNIRFFNKTREDQYAKIKKIFDANIRGSNSQNRMNLDGIIMELFIYKLSEKKSIKVDYVVKDSYTEIDEYSSRVNNCKELCMRNHDIMRSII